MNTLTTEQIRGILAGAPDDDNHFLELDGNHTRYTKLASDHHNLSDLEEILELRERVEELETNVDMALSRNSMSYLLTKPKENTNERD